MIAEAHFQIYIQNIVHLLSSIKTFKQLFGSFLKELFSDINGTFKLRFPSDFRIHDINTFFMEQIQLGLLDHCME